MVTHRLTLTDSRTEKILQHTLTAAFLYTFLLVNFLKSRTTSATVCPCPTLTILCRWLLISTHTYIFKTFFC